MHDKCLLADWRFFVGLHSCLVYIVVEAFWSWFNGSTEGRVQILNASDFFLSWCVFIWVNLNRWLPLELC